MGHMIEMQGDLESRNKEHLEGKFIGDLHFTKQGVPVMIVGHHILYGKIQELEKPLLTMEKKRVEGSGNTAAPVDSEEAETSTEYVIKAIVKKKIVFKTRPKPIIAMPKKA